MQIGWAGKYVIIRAESAGCFAGILREHEEDWVTLEDCRRLWYWEGAASLSQLAVSGTSNPKGCKFPAPVGKAKILRVIEILEVTAKAEKSIRAVPVWEV